MNARPPFESLWPEKIHADDARILRHSLRYGATPLSTTGLPEVAKRQETVQENLRKRITKKLRGRSPLIRDFAEYNFLGRFARRLDRNRASYDTRLEAEIPESIKPAHDRVLIGDGSIRDALEVITGTKMRSIELARLTHPNIDMATNEDLQEMHEMAYEAIAELGGVIHEDTETTYELSNVDTIVPCGSVDAAGNPVENAAVREGIMATAKRQIGTMPDGTLVVERTSYIIDLNKLPLETAEAIRSVNTLQTPNFLQAITEIAHLNELLPYLIEHDGDEESVIPMSTTIFAHNPLVAELINELGAPKGTELSDSMRRVQAAFTEDVENLAEMWGVSPTELRRDLQRRGIGSTALSADTVLECDDEY